MYVKEKGPVALYDKGFVSACGIHRISYLL
jgi:hypothetical protein